MKAALFLSALASAAVGVVAEELKIDVTLPVVCERKTQKGDKVQMHYRGTLKASGEQFDASKFTRLASTSTGYRKSYANSVTRLRSWHSSFLPGWFRPGYQGVYLTIAATHSSPRLTI
jgi:hypothetical protein